MAKHRPFGRVFQSSLTAPEEPLDVGELQLYIGRAAVIALARVFRVFHVAKESIHLLRLQPAPGAHRSVTGDGRGNCVEPLAKAGGSIHLGEVVGKIAYQAAGVQLAEGSRNLADG